MTTFFTSDHHFGHKHILEYTQRPYTSVDEMDDDLVFKWNCTVGKNDLVYHLGDFALCATDRAIKIATLLNGQKFLIFGNHDKALRKNAEFLSHWVWAKDMAQCNPEGQRVILCHYAMRSWNQMHRGSWQLYGHSHGSLAEDMNMRSCDVGVDVWDGKPVSYEQLKERFADRFFVPIDHHQGDI